MMLDFQSEVAN